MNRMPVLTKTLRDWRVAAVLAGLVLALIAAMDVLIYPQYRGRPERLPAARGVQGNRGRSRVHHVPRGLSHCRVFLDNALRAHHHGDYRRHWSACW